MHNPMLCESMRRQRNDLALSMLWYYKDAAARIEEIRAVILDVTKYECVDQFYEHASSIAKPKGKTEHPLYCSSQVG